ncbi:hypothetical protein ACFQYP_14335 [Nonomuraea antimicrobica]
MLVLALRGPVTTLVLRLRGLTWSRPLLEASGFASGPADRR